MSDTDSKIQRKYNWAYAAGIVTGIAGYAALAFLAVTYPHFVLFTRDVTNLQVLVIPFMVGVIVAAGLMRWIDNAEEARAMRSAGSPDRLRVSDKQP